MDIEKVKKIYGLEKELFKTINGLTSNVNDKRHTQIVELFTINPLVKKIEENNEITTFFRNCYDISQFRCL